MSDLPYNYRADFAGRVPQPGDYVAYNFGGNIATGFIRHVGKTGRFYITQVLPVEGHESIVKGGPKCLLVLDRPADT